MQTASLTVHVERGGTANKNKEKTNANPSVVQTDGGSESVVFGVAGGGVRHARKSENTVSQVRYGEN